MTEKQILNRIDSLWRRFDREAWLENLVNLEVAGVALRELARAELGDGDAASILDGLRSGRVPTKPSVQPMRVSKRDAADPPIIVDGRSRRVSTLSLSEIEEIRDAIEDGPSGHDEIDDVVTDADPRTLRCSRRYVSAFTFAHWTKTGRWFAMRRSS